MSPPDLGSYAIPAHTGYYVTETCHHEAPANTDPSKVKLPNPCTVLITGGGRGLGEATAYAFAKAGASDIILAARTAAELDTVAANLGKMSSNINVSTVRCDVTSEPDVLALTDLVKTKHSSRLDVLVNNAGFLDAGWQPITAESAPASEWKKVFDVNVYGVYLVTRHLLPLLLGTPNGLKTVIGITSMSSHFASPSIAMGMSKLALNRFIEFLAASYEAEGLMSYALHPGGVKTRMSTDKSKVPEQLSESKFLALSEMECTVLTSVILVCIDSPDLSAGMAVWLSREPRPWLNGRCKSHANDLSLPIQL
jgi:NAD(P)-dependent dehydrogenase (short-subunit alcohol dehydrogenase family)